MKLGPPYPKPPITEAVVDIRVQATAITVAELDNLVVEDYPIKKPRIEYQGQIQFGPQTATSTSQRLLGYVFMDEREKKVFQARIDGFTFSRLGLYKSWNEVKTEARRLWEIYRTVVKPDAITRIAVRYVNRIDLPMPVNDFNQYLRTYPEVSCDKGQGVNRFFMTFDSLQVDIRAMLRLNLAMVPPPAENVVSVMLDIDLFKDSNVPQGDDAIWEYFEQLAKHKNRVFEDCITDDARRLFQ